MTGSGRKTGAGSGRKRGLAQFRTKRSDFLAILLSSCFEKYEVFLWFSRSLGFFPEKSSLNFGLEELTMVSRFAC